MVRTSTNNLGKEKPFYQRQKGKLIQPFNQFPFFAIHLLRGRNFIHPASRLYSLRIVTWWVQKANLTANHTCHLLLMLSVRSILKILYFRLCFFNMLLHQHTTRPLVLQRFHSTNSTPKLYITSTRSLVYIVVLWPKARMHEKVSFALWILRHL